MSNIKEQSEKILKQYGLDFRVNKTPLKALYNVGGKQTYLPTDYFALVHSKTKEVLKAVKGGYRVSQNAEVMELVLQGMQQFGELSVHKAGSLDGGRKIFIQLEIEGVVTVGTDTLTRFVTIIDSNDGSSGLSIGVGDYTMSCSNQFYYFYSKGQAKFRHSASMDKKIGEIPNLIALSLQTSDKLVDAYKTFYNTPVTNADRDSLVEAILGYSKASSVSVIGDLSKRAINAMDSLYEMMTMEMAQKGQNLWGLHSGVTRWTTHTKSAPKRENGRIESAMVGTNYKTSQISLEWALNFIETVI